MEKICLWCKQTYLPRSRYQEKIQKYCSRRCQGKARSQAIKGIHISPATEWKPDNVPTCPIKKGEHISKATEFKKGHKWPIFIQEKMVKGQNLVAEKRTDPDNRLTITCPTCYKSFSDFKSNNRRFCSRKCFESFPKSKDTLIKMGKNHRSMKGSMSPSWKGGPIPIKCEICGKEKYYQKWKVDRGQGRFCSNECRGIWVGLTTKGRKRTPEQVRNSLRRRTPSGLELKFQDIVKKHSLPYRYVGNGKFFIEQFNPDFINTNHEKVAVEVYAKFHKELGGRSEESWKRKRSRVFGKYGWKVVYFEAKEVNEERVLSKLKGGPSSQS